MIFQFQALISRCFQQRFDRVNLRRPTEHGYKRGTAHVIVGEVSGGCDGGGGGGGGGSGHRRASDVEMLNVGDGCEHDGDVARHARVTPHVQRLHQRTPALHGVAAQVEIDSKA